MAVTGISDQEDLKGQGIRKGSGGLSMSDWMIE